MTTIEKPLIDLVEELSPEARSEVRDFVEFLVAKQRRQLALQAQTNGWLKGFFERTARSVPDAPNRDTLEIDRPLDDPIDELPSHPPEKPSS